jgi:hypothetical protein
LVPRFLGSHAMAIGGSEKGPEQKKKVKLSQGESRGGYCISSLELVDPLVTDIVRNQARWLRKKQVK